MGYETLFNGKRFSDLVADKVKAVGGYRAAEKLTGVKFATIHAIAEKGAEPRAENLFRLLKWITGRVPKF